MENKLDKSHELIGRSEEIVISGIAGRFPDSDNVRDFQQNLFNKIDLISDDNRRWDIRHPEIPSGTGKLNNIDKFDASFFDINFKQAHTMDPCSRMLLEHVYEAIIDAGINPQQLRGTKTGVFIGSCVVETEKIMIHKKIQGDGLGIVGCAKNMLSNKISYCFNFTGPSYTIDTACSSTLYAMEHAYRAMRNGQCDAALVGAANLCLHPHISRLFFRLGIVSFDNCCKCFDNNATGYVRSEAVSVVLLQKFKDAKRIYATVVHSKTNCDGFKEQGVTFPSSELQKCLLQEFYDECGVPLNSLEYVEAHGTGTRIGDPEELNAIGDVFGIGRNKPLKIGSVKSNMGHAEPASGMCSIAKVIIANETGIIPPNIHFKHPRSGIKALEDGRLQVVTEPMPWPGGYIGINSFGFGGANAHILLKSNPKEKINGGMPNDDLPRLIVVSGRTQEAVENILRDIESRPLDVEYVKLLHDIHADNIFGHSYRGYITVRNDISCEKFNRRIDHYDGEKRQIWFVFSGVGSELAGMSTALLRFPVFRKAIEKCNKVLKSRGIDIYDVLVNGDKSTFDNILYFFVGIAVIQIGLVDLLASMNIFPDYIIGHSVGELGCAYADGCLTVEQIILVAYFRGLACLEANTISGSMATVALGYKNVSDLCPPDIEVVCHNSSESSTICGPVESMKAFMVDLQSKDIFVQVVSCSNVLYHSRYIANAQSKLLEYLEKVIPERKLRSPKWVSTSVPHNQWTTVEARFSSSEYHSNNLLNAVLFEEVFSMIPKNSVTIEITSNNFLHSILKESIDSRAMNISLTQCNHNDDVEVFLQAIGELFIMGLQPIISNLYPEVQLPVSRGTPMISPLIKWDHSDDWYVCKFQLQDKIDSGVRSIEVSLADEEYECMAGHVIDGRNLLPAAGYLVLVWETLGMMRGELYTGVSVVFQNIRFLRETTLPKQGTLKLSVMIQKGTGRFEVCEEDTSLVTGEIYFSPNPIIEKMNLLLSDNDEVEKISRRDFYKELTLRGYQYEGLFKGIESYTIDGSRGRISWTNNWVAFMENMIQIKIFGIDSRSLLIPTGIQKLIIDTDSHHQQIRSMFDKKEFPVQYTNTYDLINAGGVQIRGIKLSAIPRRLANDKPVLESYKFVAYRDRAEMSFKEAVHLVTHLVTENHFTLRWKLLEVGEENGISPDNLISMSILETLKNISLIQADVSLLGNVDAFEEGSLPENISLIKPKNLPTNMNAVLLSGRNILTHRGKCETISQLLFALKDDGFIMTLESGNVKDLFRSAEYHNLNIIVEKMVGEYTLLLLRKRIALSKHPKVVQVGNDTFIWLDELKFTMKAEMESNSGGKARILVVGEKQFENGVLGLVNCLRKEPGGEMIRGFLIQDDKAPLFSESIPLYSNQLKLDLAINVLRLNGEWGSYRHSPLPAPVPRPVFHAQVHQLIPGDLNSIQWIEGPIKPDCSDPDIVRIVYSAINSRDVMFATGKLATEVATKSRIEQECLLGCEFSGIDVAGHRVMGIIPSRALANYAILDRNLTWYVPKHWTLEDAATVPYAYATSYYALYMRGHMKKNDKVLIHTGSGGVGQAAIQIALNDGCEVFTTVGTVEKRRFIKRKFPQIPNNHIGSSRDTSFEQLILKETNGRGVDIVLNSLAGEKLQASIRCLAVDGRFLEIDEFDMVNDSRLSMMMFHKGISFHLISLDKFFDAVIERKLEIKEIVQKALDEDSIKPLDRTVFSENHLAEAFRCMETGKHIGEVFVKISDEKNFGDLTIPALPRYYCLPNRSYIIIGGLGGFGLELVNWLIIRGARNFVLTSRTGFKNGYQRMRVESWRSKGVRVVIVSGKNAANHKECAEILKIASDLHPVDAIFNVAVVLKDGLLENQTSRQFEESFKPKAWSTKILDEFSRKVCPQLRHFVVFSSLSCGHGNAGQTNYGMSNSIMERICEKRVAEGFPALAIQWGPIGCVGVLTEKQYNNKKFTMDGKKLQNITSCLHELDGFLTQDSPIVSSMVLAEKHVCVETHNILETVMNIMNIKDLKSISHQIPLPELGMDSIMCVEIEHTLKREFDISLPARDIRGLNFANLIEMNNSSQDKKNIKNGHEKK